MILYFIYMNAKKDESGPNLTEGVEMHLRGAPDSEIEVADKKNVSEYSATVRENAKPVAARPEAVNKRLAWYMFLVLQGLSMILT